MEEAAVIPVVQVKLCPSVRCCEQHWFQVPLTRCPHFLPQSHLTVKTELPVVISAQALALPLHGLRSRELL